MAKRKTTKKTATKRVSKKTGKKKVPKKKVAKKKAEKKKAAKKSAKKTTKKPAGRRKAKKKTVKKAAKKKATKKKVVKKKVSKKTAKKAAKRKVAKKKASKKTVAAPKVQAKLTIPKSKVMLGKAVPAFKVEGTGGKTIESSELVGARTVLFFYPKDSTPGCTIEAHDFTRLHPDFKKHKTEVFGVSRDSMRSHENFKSKQKYSVDLLSDESEKLCSIFGVIKLKNMYGRQVRGIERSTFVLDEKGVLIQEWRGVKVPGHADEVFDFIKRL